MVVGLSDCCFLMIVVFNNYFLIIIVFNDCCLQRLLFLAIVAVKRSSNISGAHRVVASQRFRRTLGDHPALR
jgi:hypothetical protein